jgi:hypothetical protein
MGKAPRKPDPRKQLERSYDRLYALYESGDISPEDTDKLYDLDAQLRPGWEAQAARDEAQSQPMMYDPEVGVPDLGILPVADPLYQKARRLAEDYLPYQISNNLFGRPASQDFLDREGLLGITGVNLATRLIDAPRNSALGNPSQAGADLAMGTIGLLGLLPGGRAAKEVAEGGVNAVRTVGRDIADRFSQPGPMPTTYANPIPGLLGDRASARIPKLHEDWGPNDAWLQAKLAKAEKNRLEFGNEGGRLGNLGGGDGVTGWFSEPIMLNPNALMGVRGLHGEEAFRDTGRKLTDLQKAIAEEGYKPSPIVVVVREDGVPFISEGNHRLAEAIKSGRPEIPVEIKYMRGAQEVEGLMNPNNLPFPAPMMPMPLASQSDPAIDQAEEVLGLLRSGRESEITEQMLDMGDPVLNARLSEHLYRNYDLPMDYESRMARAAEMGALDEYHGTTTGSEMRYPRADFGSGTRKGTGFFTSNNPYVASSYADPSFGSVFPMMNANPPSGLASIDAAGDIWSQIPGEATVSRRGAEFPVSSYASGPADMGGVFNTNQIARGAAIEGDGGVRFLNLLDRSIHLPRVKDDPSVMREFQEKSSVPSTVTTRQDTRGMRSRFARFDPRLAHLRNLNASLAAAGIPLGLLAMQPEEEQY